VSPPVVHVASGREWRGGQRQVWLLARELGALGVDQVVITTRDSELARRLRASGVPVRTPAWQAGLDPRVIPSLLHEIRRPAIVHAHDAHALTLAGLCASLTGSPLVVTRRVTFPLRRRFFWRRACRIIVISRAVGEALLSDGLDPSRLVLIPSAVDPAASGYPDVDLRTRLGIPQKGQLAINLGALTPEKDQSTLVAAAAGLVQDLPDLHWVIVGEGPLRKSLQQEITQLGLNHRVHLLGRMDDPHLALNGADVFVLSSSSEGLGSSVLAAMARGIAVVATRVGGVPELLESGAGVLVDPGDPSALAAGVRRTLQDPDLRRQVIRNGRTEVEKFSVRTMAERVLSVYRSCAHSLDGS
jgi:glycosyltransferase involved in cell wall biosynthesis